MTARLFGKKLFDEKGKWVSESNNIDKEGIKYCVWCGGNLTSNRRRYCKKECSSNFYDEYASRYDWRVKRLRIIEKFSFTCQKCFKQFKNNYKAFDLHHIKPAYEGGTSEEENLTPLCVKCHKKETAKLMKAIAKDKTFKEMEIEMRKQKSLLHFT